MSDSMISPHFRALGWNVHFLSGPDGDRFAGLFHPPQSKGLTHRRAVDEIRLCFKLTPEFEEDEDDSWSNIAFGYPESVDGHQPPTTEGASAPKLLGLVYGEHLDKPLLTPPSNSTSPATSTLQLHLVWHADCSLGPTEPLVAHLKAGCAKHIARPSFHRDIRYLPLQEKVAEGSVPEGLQYKKNAQPSNASSMPPPRRAASRSGLPNNEATFMVTRDDGDLNYLVPTEDVIPLEASRQKMFGFHDSCLASSTECAITSHGRSWYKNPSVGPGIKAGQIVSPEHYYLYPTPNPLTIGSTISAADLREAWERTWSPRNGLLLMSHLHEFFKARLFSIDPVTFKVRVFVPYDVLMQYNGSTANISQIVDRKALRHHYDMCCIENMAAEVSTSEQQLMHDTLVKHVLDERNAMYQAHCHSPTDSWTEPGPLTPLGSTTTELPTEKENRSALKGEGQLASNTPRLIQKVGEVLGIMQHHGEGYIEYQIFPEGEAPADFKNSVYGKTWEKGGLDDYINHTLGPVDHKNCN